MLSAAAGLGKTTLSRQAIAENELAPWGVDVWLPLTPDLRASSSLAAEMLARLGDTDPPAGEDLALITERIVSRVLMRSPVDVGLVLDDVHHLPAGGPGAQLLERLAHELPANGHLLLAGRSIPLPAARRVRVIT